jgi:hypothetical protein
MNLLLHGGDDRSWLIAAEGKRPTCSRLVKARHPLATGPLGGLRATVRIPV